MTYYLIYKKGQLCAQTDNKDYKDVFTKRLKSYGIKTKVEKHKKLPDKLLRSVQFQYLLLDERLDDYPYLDGVYTEEEIQVLIEYITQEVYELEVSLNTLQLMAVYLKLSDSEKQTYHVMVERMDSLVVDIMCEGRNEIFMYGDYFDIEWILEDLHLERIPSTLT